ncbi:MAG: hypothetical protein AAFY25_06815 [Pseudomonadota bacterium]
MRQHSRRGVLGLAILATTSASAALAAGRTHAFDFEELDPTDTVPRRFSVRRFLELSKAELYKVNLAVKRGRGIIIEGYSRSESREIIRLAAKDPAAARAVLTR